MIFILVHVRKKDNMSRFFLHFFQRVGSKGKKVNQYDKKLSVAHHISGSTHHMMVIFGTHLQNDDILDHFFIFSKF